MVKPQLPIPGQLRVIVRVDVHDAGGEAKALGIHRLPGRAQALPDGGDAAAGDGDAAVARRSPQAVDDARALDHEIMHVTKPPVGPAVTAKWTR